LLETASFTIPPVRQEIPSANIKGEYYAEHYARTEQGNRSGSIRNSLQQARLQGSGALLVAQLHPAQRALRYEAGTIVADGNFVIVHGRFSGFGSPVNWIAADILRIEDGILVEHWDVIQDEATEEQSKSKAPMFGDRFPE
jgi:hypothetical protein